MPSFGAIGHSAIVGYFVRIGFHDFRRLFGDACTLRTRSIGRRQSWSFGTLLPLFSFLSFEFTFEFSFATFLPPLSSLPPFSNSLPPFANSGLPPFSNSGLPPLTLSGLPTFVIVLSLAFCSWNAFSLPIADAGKIGGSAFAEGGRGTCALNFGNPADCPSASAQ